MMIDFAVALRRFKAFGDRSRLLLLRELLERPLHVGALVRRTGMRQNLVSHHLRVLREAGLVSARRRGPFVIHELAGGWVRDLLVRTGASPSTGVGKE